MMRVTRAMCWLLVERELVKKGTIEDGVAFVYPNNDIQAAFGINTSTKVIVLCEERQDIQSGKFEYHPCPLVLSGELVIK